jgi:hypothetical protein
MQKYEAVPITDPTEIAELEAKLKRFEDTAGRVRAPGSTRLSKGTTAKLLELAEQLSEQSRVELITQIASGLSKVQQSTLVKQLRAQLGADGPKGNR